MSTTPMPEAEPASGLRLASPSRRENAGAGWDWIASGWKLFTRAPLMWIISIVVLLSIAFLMALVPFVGSVAFQLLQGVFAAGFMVGCHSLAQGGDFELEHLFAGFKTRFGNLLIVGVIFVVASLLIVMVFAAFVGFSVFTAVLTGNAENAVSTIAASSLTLLLGMLVMLALMVPLLAAYWFAPALVVLNGMAPIDAMKESFIGCMRNFIPFLVYGLVMGFFAIIAVIPLGLGMLVWVPLAIASTYTAYRGIFVEEASAAAELPTTAL